MLFIGGLWIASGLVLQEQAEEKLLPTLLRALPEAGAFQALPVQAPRHLSQSAASRAMHGPRMQDERKTGTVKWFNVEKGYGFISQPDEEAPDIFVHQTDIYAPGFRSLAEGETVEFVLTTDPSSGKTKAVEVTGPDGAYVQGAQKPAYDSYDDGFY